MLDTSIITIYIPTIFVVSMTPSICMTLALTLGMKIGILNTFWMIIGELVGISLVFLASVLGIAPLILDYPKVFTGFKIIGGLYIIYIGIKSCLDKDKIDLNISNNQRTYSILQLFLQGFTSSFFHPKAWAFLLIFVPRFIKPEFSIVPQALLLLGILMVIELNSLTIYASCGKILNKILKDTTKIRIVNLVSGLLLIIVGVWLIIT